MIRPRRPARSLPTAVRPVRYGTGNAMGLFKKRANDTAEIDELKEQISAMAARLDATDAVKQQLGAQVQGIVTRLDTPPEPAPAPPPPAPSVHPDEFRAMVVRLKDLTARVDAPPAPLVELEPPVPSVTHDELEAVSSRVQTIADRLEEVDARITSISSELANQINELSGDIDNLDTSEQTAELIELIHDSQVKLANEQARYQIAFRQDLANLADFLKHR